MIRLFIVSFLISFLLSTVFAEVQAKEWSLTVTWEPSEGAIDYIMERGGCGGEVVHSSPERKYESTISEVTEFCIYAKNHYGRSDPYVFSVDPNGKPPEPVKGVSVNFVNVSVEISTGNGGG